MEVCQEPKWVEEGERKRQGMKKKREKGKKSE